MALLVLLGSMGAIQAQATLARVTLLTDTAKAAREGGKQEAAGDVFLDIAGTPDSIASYTLTYSVPVILPEVASTGYAVDESDLEKGIVAFGALTGVDGYRCCYYRYHVGCERSGLRADHGNA